MSFSPAITVSQSGSTPQSVTVADSSTGSDGSIAKRRIYLSDAYGNYLTGNGTVTYTDWILANSSIALSILKNDLAANIKVDWLDSGNNVLYTYNNNYPLSQFGKQFFFSLVSSQGLTPGVLLDTNYLNNITIFWTNVVAGDNAITNGNDLSGAQNCYNQEIYMMNNRSLYFSS